MHETVLNNNSNSNNNNNNNNPGKHDIKELQKTATWGAAHMLRKSADVKRYKMCIVIYRMACIMYCNYGTAATLYTLETCCVSGM